MDGSRGTGAVDYGPEEAAMQAYLRDGERRAAELGNRGPIRFTSSGELHPDIIEAYWRCGFYIFEGVLKADELADIERDLHDILDRLPAERGAPRRRSKPYEKHTHCILCYSEDSSIRRDAAYHSSTSLAHCVPFMAF